jgi:fructokinase
LYITVGTGIGIGLIINGKPVHGMMHPEGGHARVTRHRDDDYKGKCPFHNDCLEGLCATGAIVERLGLSGPEKIPELDDSAKIWDMIGFYLGTFCANLYLATSVERIIIGGGVMNRACLFPKIRNYFDHCINGYVKMP